MVPALPWHCLKETQRIRACWSTQATGVARDVPVLLVPHASAPRGHGGISQPVENESCQPVPFLVPAGLLVSSAAASARREPPCADAPAQQLTSDSTLVPPGIARFPTQQPFGLLDREAGRMSRQRGALIDPGKEPVDQLLRRFGAERIAAVILNASNPMPSPRSRAGWPTPHRAHRHTPRGCSDARPGRRRPGP